jgi:uncharacterized membrane protein
MGAAYALHIIAGSVALVSGYLALYAPKGGPVHRKGGTVFVYAMLAMTSVGMTLAVFRPAAPEINVPAALLTSYLVVTALTAVHPPARGARALLWGGMLIVAVVAIYNLNFGIDRIINAGKGIPPFPFLMFGVVGLLGAVGDWRVIRGRALTGASRIARHLWRMTFALLIAALSFFIGQAKVIPKPIRISWLLAMPVLAVALTLFYWLWRVSIRRTLRGLVVKDAGRGGVARDGGAVRRGTANRETVRRAPSAG